MSDALKVLKSVLSTVGVGQSELRYLFDETLKRFRERDYTKVEEWNGAAKVLEDMVRVLEEENVINSETKKYIRNAIKESLSESPKN
jgi:hypothetical protein